MDSSATAFLLAAILIVAVIGVVYLMFATKNGPNLNIARYQTRWLEIENGIVKDNAATWQMAIINADKLLDQALRDKRIKGSTMGERMKSANKLWRNADHIWSAHKIRNRLAHETDATVNYEITLRAMSAFKQGLKDLGAI
ncbi:hypothetical protein EOL96_00030 [Candidatus Saccharibacteria bacterium]|nr:hypothetical protein [Candidatus Saccharibacteria bacterium]